MIFNRGGGQNVRQEASQEASHTEAILGDCFWGGFEVADVRDMVGMGIVRGGDDDGDGDGGGGDSDDSDDREAAEAEAGKRRGGLAGSAWLEA